jgi:cell division protein ZapA (FtsZ GTPase activity inhibitor)
MDVLPGDRFASSKIWGPEALVAIAILFDQQLQELAKGNPSRRVVAGLTGCLETHARKGNAMGIKPLKKKTQKQKWDQM